MDIDAFIESLMKTESPPKFPHSMYYTEGTKYLNLRLYPKALEFLNNAIKYDRTHVKSLLKRSKCFIGLREYHKALEDANVALKMCPSSVEANDLKGKAQYLMGDFEGGYLTYLNGRRMKPANETFRLGKQLCLEALNNSMNPIQKIKVDNRDVSTLLNTKQDDKKFQNCLKYLKSKRDCFGKDKKFMKELMRNKNLASIHGFCAEAVDCIKNCERFWAVQKPLHTRKSTSPVVLREGLKKPDAASIQLSICKAAICRAENHLKKGRIDDSLSEAEKMLYVVESLPKEMDEKPKLKCDAFHVISLAHKKGNNLFLSRRYLLKELELANEFNLSLPQTRAYHLLGENYQMQGNVSKALRCFNKVAEAMHPEEIELLQEEVSADDVEHLESAQEWMDSVVAGIRMSLRESIYSPIVDTVGELLKTINSKNMEETSQSNEKVQKSLEEDEVGTSHSDEDDRLKGSSETSNLAFEEDTNDRNGNSDKEDE